MNVTQEHLLDAKMVEFNDEDRYLRLVTPVGNDGMNWFQPSHDGMGTFAFILCDEDKCKELEAEYRA